MVRVVASARRTQLVSTYGVGALLPSMDESFMVCGIDEWSEAAATEIPEPRLARSLQVETFRMPPSGRPKRRDVPVVRFPQMHFCPSCRRLGKLREFCPPDEHRCQECSRDLTPSRFVVCCPNGHIDDFPYFLWLHRGQAAGEDARHRMTLETRGRTSSLADILVRCTCGVTPVSMAGSFSPGALASVARCRGLRPWLPGSDPELCDELPRTLQRGSSNVWFGMVRSAISIPPWSEGIHRLVNRHWAVFQAIPTAALPAVIAGMNIAGPEATVEGIVQAILERRGELESKIPTDADLRTDEYEALVQGRPESSPTQQFVARSVEVDPELASLVAQVSEVARLREVRALEGFTRVLPPAPGMSASRKAPLSISRPRWLPAIEVLGEGLFLRFEEEALQAWEIGQFARGRAELVRRGARTGGVAGGPGPSDDVSARLLLLHSTAHVLLSELSLDAGYATASLRERLYVADDRAGILIYTASADSAGSLGGLAAQSDAERLASVLISAVRRASWCSADPVCIEATSTGNDALNLAACHACLLLPETSCEQMNTHLDRATLIGLPDAPWEGFFSGLLMST